MDIKRREFLVRSVLGVAGAAAAGVAARAARAAESAAVPAAAEAGIDPTARVPLGKSGIMVSRIGFGTGMRGGNRQSNQTRLGERAFGQLLRHAYEQGIVTFDMADLYGSHSFVANALREMPRNSLVYISKIWWRSGGIPELERLDADLLVKRFVRELRTDYIDLVLLHCVVDADWPGQLARQMETLARLKTEGLIRAHGVSCHSVAALRAAAAEPWVDAVHARINPYGVKMDAAPEEVVPVLRQLHAAGKGVTGMKIIGEGEFGDSEEKRQSSVNFVLGLGCVDAMVVGFEAEREVDEFKARVTLALRAAASIAAA